MEALRGSGIRTDHKLAKRGHQSKAAWRYTLDEESPELKGRMMLSEGVMQIFDYLHHVGDQ